MLSNLIETPGPLNVRIGNNLRFLRSLCCNSYTRMEFLVNQSFPRSMSKYNTPTSPLIKATQFSSLVGFPCIQRKPLSKLIPKLCFPSKLNLSKSVNFVETPI